MSGIKESYLYFKAHPIAIAATVAGALCGACLGVIAYFQNWLG